MTPIGTVYLVGAGPGDPGLITARGLDLLAAADVIVYDRLASPRLLSRARRDAELVYVGKEPDGPSVLQPQTNELLVRKAREGKMVVRLKGGDPFVFGRGGEEALALRQAGVRFEVVPGVTAAVAAAAYAGIPITHRGIASSVAFVTGHEDPAKGASSIDWARLAVATDVIAFYMGVGRLDEIAAKLMEHGRSPDTPSAAIRWGTTPSQQIVVAPLGEIAARVAGAGLRPPAIVIVGQVVELRDKLAWFEQRPLFGRRIVVTGPEHQSGELSERLAQLGADVIGLPVIRIEAPGDLRLLDEAIRDVGRFTWVVFTSVNGVDSFFGRLMALGFDVRRLAQCKVASIGSGTADRLRHYGIRADLVPESFDTSGLLDALRRLNIGGWDSILLPRADIAPAGLTEGLAELGASVVEVVAYHTVINTAHPVELVESIRAGNVDAVTFTSASTVRGFAETLGEEAAAELSSRVQFITIGPMTTAEAKSHGWQVARQAAVHTVEGLADAVVAAMT